MNPAKRRAHVKGDRRGHGPGTITWDEHVQAWQAYAKKYSTTCPSALRIAARGGFKYTELVYLLGHQPETWVPQ